MTDFFKKFQRRMGKGVMPVSKSQKRPKFNRKVDNLTGKKSKTGRSLTETEMDFLRSLMAKKRKFMTPK